MIVAGILVGLYFIVGFRWDILGVLNFLLGW